VALDGFGWLARHASRFTFHISLLAPSCPFLQNQAISRGEKLAEFAARVSPRLAGDEKPGTGFPHAALLPFASGS
jgi:hypothetical protein